MFFASKEMRFLSAILLQCLIAGSAFAGDSVDAKQMRFLPLSSAKNISASHSAAPPAAFIPLSKSRFPAPMRFETKKQEPEKLIAKNDLAQATAPSDKGGKKMSPEQAQQILSIFTQNE